jgi:hypothetical protein
MSVAGERVAEAFNGQFGQFGITIDARDVVIGERRTIGTQGWRITYRVDPDDAGSPILELYATHRMTNDRHLLISADGHVDDLEAIQEMYAFDAKIAGSEDAAKAEYYRHNQEVASYLRERGLYPEGDINAFLRTIDVDAGEGSVGSEGDVGAPED